MFSPLWNLFLLLVERSQIVLGDQCEVVLSTTALRLLWQDTLLEDPEGYVRFFRLLVLQQANWPGFARFVEVGEGFSRRCLPPACLTTPLCPQSAP